MLKIENIRSVVSIQAGIKVDKQITGARFIDYQPGNGTRYELLLTYLTGLDIPGCSEDYVLISFKQTPNTWKSYPFKNYVTWNYIQEKFDVNLVDSLVLEEIVNFLLGHATPELETLVKLGNKILSS